MSSTLLITPRHALLFVFLLVVHINADRQSEESEKQQKQVRQCNTNEVWRECSSCEGTCSQPTPACDASCKPARCQCNDGLVRHANGTCIPPAICGPVRTPGEMDNSSGAVQQCPQNEHFDNCVRCEPSCANGLPLCPNAPCVQKCVCNLGLVRHPNGQCVQLPSCNAAVVGGRRRKRQPSATTPCTSGTGANARPTTASTPRTL